MSSYEQDKRFKDLMSELESIVLCDTDAYAFLERVEQAFEDRKLSTSQYDKLVRECEDFCEPK